jgi:hypothetical protein
LNYLGPCRADQRVQWSKADTNLEYTANVPDMSSVVTNSSLGSSYNCLDMITPELYGYVAQFNRENFKLDIDLNALTIAVSVSAPSSPPSPPLPPSALMLSYVMFSCIGS